MANILRRGESYEKGSFNVFLMLVLALGSGFGQQGTEKKLSMLQVFSGVLLPPIILLPGVP